MAPRGPVRARDFDYSNVGKAGRRTGITLKEGKLDEHGMEELDGIFSSPEKSPAKTNGNGVANDTLINSEDMETGGSSIPEPAEVLSGRRGRRNAFLLPPRSRSPIKTFVTGSPRRTPGIGSSPMPHSDQSSSPTSSRRAHTRALDFSKGQLRLGKSPLGVVRATSYPPGSEEIKENGKGKAARAGPNETTDASDHEKRFLQDANGDYRFIEPHEAYHERFENYGEVQALADEQPAYEGNDDDAGVGDFDETSPSAAVKGAGRGRKRKNILTKPHNSSFTSNHTRRSIQRSWNNDTGATKKQSSKRQGRKQKDLQAEIYRDPEDQAQDPRPAKKAKPSGPAPQDANRQMSARQEQELNKVVETITNRSGPLKNRSLYILRRETPSDDGARHTRSGRVSVRPLAYWRNERCVYGDGDAEIGQRFPLSTIKEIIRTEEHDSVQRRHGKKGTKKKYKIRKNHDDLSEDDSVDNSEPWETQVGVFYGHVKKWDSETQTATHDEEMMDIAYAPAAVETHEVKDSTFRFAKILSTPFLGSGFVDMPPGAVKKPKNSKRMHMVFFVYHGRIRVEISGLKFSAGKGCVFQVPRGNNYSFANDYENSASIFFTQGCIPLDTEADVNTGGPISLSPSVNRNNRVEGSKISKDKRKARHVSMAEK